jgi:hypothetical protein
MLVDNLVAIKLAATARLHEENGAESLWFSLHLVLD